MGHKQCRPRRQRGREAHVGVVDVDVATACKVHVQCHCRRGLVLDDDRGTFCQVLFNGNYKVLLLSTFGGFRILFHASTNVAADEKYFTVALQDADIA